MLELTTALFVVLALGFSVRRARRGRVEDERLTQAMEAGLRDPGSGESDADVASLARESRAAASPELRQLARSELVGRIDLARKTHRLERAGLVRIPFLAGGAGLAVLAAGGLELVPTSLALPALLLGLTAICLALIGAEGRKRGRALEKQRELLLKLDRLGGPSRLDPGEASGYPAWPR